jgi:hypothetical protein
VDCDWTAQAMRHRFQTVEGYHQHKSQSAPLQQTGIMLQIPQHCHYDVGYPSVVRVRAALSSATITTITTITTFTTFTLT